MIFYSKFIVADDSISDQIVKLSRKTNENKRRNSQYFRTCEERNYEIDIVHQSRRNYENGYVNCYRHRQDLERDLKVGIYK